MLRLDHSLMPNLELVDKFFFESPFAPGLEYAVPYMWGTTGIGYNSKLVEDRVEGYEQLFDFD